jgi:hypothetical protein
MLTSFLFEKRTCVSVCTTHFLEEVLCQLMDIQADSFGQHAEGLPPPQGLRPFQ